MTSQHRFSDDTDGRIAVELRVLFFIDLVIFFKKTVALSRSP
jgi:hypothetical protein